MRIWLRYLMSILVPADEVDTRVRAWSLALTIVVAASVGHWFCTDDPFRPTSWVNTWWACGMFSIASSAAISGWLGGRITVLIPLLMPVLTSAFALLYMDLANLAGYPLDAMYGIKVIGLAFFAGVAGIAVVFPVMFIREQLNRQRYRECPERESYREM